MEAEWDPAKARANLRKHRVRYVDEMTALEDARAISVRDEERWVRVSMDLVMFTPGALSGYG